MKRTSILSTLLLLLVCSAASAQNMQRRSGGPAIDFGWFGTVGLGLGAHDNEAFSDRLRSYAPQNAVGERMNYQTGPFSNVGMTLNASTAFLLGGRYVLGLSGEQVTFPTVQSINGPENPRDEYTLSGGGGGLDLGWALINEGGTLFYPYLHAGYYGFSLEYTNNQEIPVPFFEGNSVAPGTSATYDGAAPLIGGGIGLIRYLGGVSEESTAGLVLSVRLGLGTMPSRPEWKNSSGETVNNGGHTPCYCNATLSVSIGGGFASR